MRISDWSSDVCSSDLQAVDGRFTLAAILGVHQRADQVRLQHGKALAPERLHANDVEAQEIIEAVRIILEAVEKHRRGRYLGLHPQHWLEHLPHSARQPFVQQVERVKLAEAALLVRSKGIGRDLAVR